MSGGERAGAAGRPLPGPPAAISFDFWHTLVVEPGGVMAALRREAVVRALLEHEVEIEEDVLEAHLAATQALQAEAWHRGEHFEPERAATAFADAIEGLEGPGHAGVVEAYLGAGEAADLRLSRGAAETVERLAGAGIQLGIICDVGITGSRHLRAFLERAGILRHFRGWAFSDEVGHYKPSPAIFAHMRDQFELGESVIWHVGDLRRTDVAGARAAGWGSIRYRAENDDRSEDPEADHVIDELEELVELALG
ncbi:MAG: HAD family hydrolase [Solirubrobacterales bacterium]